MTKEQIEQETRKQNPYLSDDKSEFDRGKCVGFSYGFTKGALYVLDTLSKMQPTDAWKEITDYKKDEDGRWKP